MITICILQFAFCNFLLAQTEPAPVVTRLPITDPALQPAQFAAPPQFETIPSPFPTTVPAPAPAADANPRFRLQSIQFDNRYAGIYPQFTGDKTATGETVYVVNGGLKVLIQGLTAEGLSEKLSGALGPIGDVDIETDRAVIWGVDLAGLGQSSALADAPVEIYLEGNIVFRQGDRTIYAERMYYDVRNRRGQILDADIYTPAPQSGPGSIQGLVRLKAASVRQLDNNHFVAHDALVTTSRLEEPTYNLSSDTITFEDLARPAFEPYSGLPVVNPSTLQQTTQHQQTVESQNNLLYVGGVPVFYWPTIRTDLEKSSYYIDNIRIRNDSVFGFQTLLSLDAFQLCGLERPAGVDWTFDLDYLSQRGLGYGSDVKYDRDDFFGVVGPTTGLVDLWAISDDGLDNLGRDRRAINPDANFRGRAFWNHRQHVVGGLLGGWTAQAEVGLVSDRTFLEEYYENEWDNNKDEITGVRLKRIDNNREISLEANARINDFFTQTQWLPRADHYWLGQSLFGDNLTWFEHSQAAYANIGIASQPTNPQLASMWSLLPWEHELGVATPTEAAGERFVTRQELDFPLDFAPFKVVPYALGELADWGSDINGNDIQRAYYQAGLRASIPFWTVDPTVHDALFNLNGLAHKVVFDAEISYADANRNFDQFPLYDQLDDDSIEEIRRRLFFAPFAGGLTPYYLGGGGASFIDPKFDPRFYAIRSGLQGWVTSPSTEMVDDLTAVRLGMRNRLQTKRGPAGAQHIVDWITFDTNASWFPDANRDNFGTAIGLADYDFRWHLGDRFTVLSDGAADFFGDGLHTASIGMIINRPARGNLYVGYRTINGPIQGDIVGATLNYRMSPKWIGSASTSVDFANDGNIGQAFSFSRIGESLVATLGAHVDASKNNVGVHFLLEPRFLPNLSVTRKTGIEIPPVGAGTGVAGIVMRFSRHLFSDGGSGSDSTLLPLHPFKELAQANFKTGQHILATERSVFVDGGFLVDGGKDLRMRDWGSIYHTNRTPASKYSRNFRSISAFVLPFEMISTARSGAIR